MLRRIGCVSARNSCRHRCNMSDRFTRTVYSTSHARTVQYTQSRVMLRSMAHAPCRKQPPSSCSCALQLLRRATHSHMHTRRMQEAPLSLEMADAAATPGRRTPVCTPGGCRRRRPEDARSSCRRYSTPTANGRSRVLTAQPHRAERQRGRGAVRAHSNGWA